MRPYNNTFTGMELTIFTILGFLDEYMGRKIIRGRAQVECFYKTEKEVADLFEFYLHRLAAEHNLQTEIIREEKETGHIYFYSEELNDLICSYYIKNGLTNLNSNEIQKYVDEREHAYYGVGEIGESVFPVINHPLRLTEEERSTRLAFLTGAYARYGRKNRFQFNNSYHKARLVEELLIQLRSYWIRFTRKMELIPYRHEVEFKMTKEMKQHFVSYRKS